MAERPYPVPDRDTSPFWQGAAVGQLRIQRCSRCGRHVFYPRSVCPHCTGDQLEWVTASGRGVVHSFTTVHRAPAEFRDEVPFTVALVDLDEGVRMMARLDHDRPMVGMAVEVTFEAAAGPHPLPHFREVRSGG